MEKYKYEDVVEKEYNLAERKSGKNIYQQREANYDLLRVICTVAVIMIHVSHIYKNAITEASFFGQLYTEHTIIILLYNVLPRFTVPCFVMLSGAFLLSDDRNSDYRFFYKKSIKNIGIPTIVFTCLYFLYSELLACYQILTMGGDIYTIIEPFISVIKGMPLYHMWYLYTLIGIYFLVPVILNIKKNIGENTFFKLSVIMLIVTSISGWTSSFDLEWSISKSICYIGYLMMGFQLRKFFINRKNNWKGILLIFFGILTELVLTFIEYKNIQNGITELDVKYSIVGNFNPLVVVASLLFFSGFSSLNIDINLTKLSAKTLYIYLFHAGVLDLVSRVIRRIGIEGDCRIIIPITILFVFTIAHILSAIYINLWKKMEQKFSGLSHK